MKNILKSLFLLNFIFTLNSCEKDIIKITPTNNGFKTETVIAPSTQVLTFANKTDIFNKISWTKVDNGVNSVSSYKIQITDHLKDPNFLNPSEYSGAGIISNNNVRTCQLTNLELNNLINSLPTYSCGQMNIDIRVKSMLGTNNNDSFNQYSNIINFLVTGFSTSKQQLAIVQTGVTPADSPILKSSAFNNNTNFETYTYLTAGNYKFYQPDACGDFTTPTIIGKGSANGNLAINGTDINIATTGHYLIKANLTANTYSLTEYTAIGAFGKATRAGLFFPGNAPTVPFIYDNVNKEWTLIMDLITGQSFKLKAIRYSGPLTVPSATAVFPKPDFVPATGSTTFTIFGKGSTENILSDGGADIIVPGIVSLTETTKYRITVNVNNSRTYTYKLEKVL